MDVAIRTTTYPSALFPVHVRRKVVSTFHSSGTRASQATQGAPCPPASQLISLRPAPAQTRPPRRRASRAPRPLARGRFPPHLRVHRRAQSTAAWATAMPTGAVEVAMGQTPSYRPCRFATRPGPALPIASSTDAYARCDVGSLERRPSHLRAHRRGARARAVRACKACHQPLAHRASGLGRGDAGRFLDPTRAAPLRAPSCPWRAQ